MMTFDDLWWCSLTQHCIIWRIESTWVTSLRLEDHISMVSLCDLPLTSCLVVYQNIAVPFFGWWHLPCRSFFEVVPYLQSPYPLMQLPHRRTKISCVFTWCLPLVRENWQDTQRPAVDGPLHISEWPGCEKSSQWQLALHTWKLLQDWLIPFGFW